MQFNQVHFVMENFTGLECQAFRTRNCKNILIKQIADLEDSYQSQSHLTCDTALAVLSLITREIDKSKELFKRDVLDFDDICF